MSTARKRMPAARRRDQLMTAALSRFGDQGFHDTSMDDIAEEAGVTKPVLYQHFPSKRILYIELIETVGAEMLEMIAARAGTETTPRRRVTAGFEAFFQFVIDNVSGFRLMFNSAGHQDEEFSLALRRVEDDVAHMIGDFIEARIDQDHRDQLGFGIVGAAEMTARQWIVRSESTARETGTPLVLEPAEGTLLAARLSDVVWAGLRSLPGQDGEDDHVGL